MTVIVGRSRVATQHGIVAANQPLAAQAGVRMLERGGHAVDAAIAANAVMGVVDPEMNGIGGDLFAIVYDAATGTLHGLNASGWAQTGATIAKLKADGHKEMPADGIFTVTVPGAVAGWSALHRRFGRLPFSEVLAPAISCATHGFPVSDIIAARWSRWRDKLAGDRDAARTYLIQGHTPAAGELFANHDLAGALERIARNGRRAFYEGSTADAMLRLSAARGGAMTAADLNEFDVEWVDPIATTYRGWTVFELPPNTQGVAALMMLNIMERFPLGEYGLHSAAALHVMIEAKKLAYADMLRHVGDPRWTAVPVPALIDKTYGEARARAIDPRRAAQSVAPSALERVTTSKGGDTIYLCAIDREGSIVSLIQSIYEGFGSGLVPPGCGFMLHNRGALFSLDERHPNALAPRKRPLHTIIPGFMQRGAERVGFGIMGGWNQAQAHAQFVANVADFGLDIQEALEAGRFTKPTFDGTDVFVESLMPEPVTAELRSLGHDVEVVPPRSGTFGYGQAVMSDAAGIHFGASEPRHDGAAIPEAPLKETKDTRDT
jgi:gamma-glutamyltranspeptidase / glutathione hydrolase